MTYTPSQLLTLSQDELDAIFRAGTSATIPNGEANGTAIVGAGKFTHEVASIVNIFAWQGKTFDAEHGTLTNRISAFGVNAIVAQVYKGPSLFDGKECIVLDYSKTSLVAKHVRDEIRRSAQTCTLAWCTGIRRRPSILRSNFPRHNIVARA